MTALAANPFKPASLTQARARIALDGPAGSGKTYTALVIASGLGERIAVIDTERGSAAKYAGIFTFDSIELTTFSPQGYTTLIKAAEANGYDVLVIDSLSHAWNGTGGAIQQVDHLNETSKSSNSYFAWNKITPIQNAMVDAILASRCHIIATMRTKTEYVIETNAQGKQVPRKIGLAPIQRDGVEYEFDIVGDMLPDNTMVISKSRCFDLSGAVIPKPGPEVAATLKAWLGQGVEPTVPYDQGFLAAVVVAASGELPMTLPEPPPADGNVTAAQEAEIDRLCGILGQQAEIPLDYTYLEAERFITRATQAVKDRAALGKATAEPALTKDWAAPTRDVTTPRDQPPATVGPDALATPTCTCGLPREYKRGVNKAGRDYAGWFNTCGKASCKPEWAATR